MEAIASAQSRTLAVQFRNCIGKRDQIVVFFGHKAPQTKGYRVLSGRRESMGLASFAKATLVNQTKTRLEKPTGTSANGTCVVLMGLAVFRRPDSNDTTNEKPLLVLQHRAAFLLAIRSRRSESRATDSLYNPNEAVPIRNAVGSLLCLHTAQ
ncbi:hypothetical protein [Gluconacetobacter entanii]|uniref:hypothetical protein n=1 Tax=Gluconacetobacter entanii TaxID=108528 RepID=UPI00142E8C1E|nr:hypothetical protein [Gluconacetobacter entanii]